MLRQAGPDAETQVDAARIQSVLTDEIHHRKKNILTMVTAVVRQSMRSARNLADAESAIGARLIAMAKAHDLMLRADCHSADLSAVIRVAIEHLNIAGGHIQVQGETFEVASSSILPMSLLLTELCTNAAKYGALSKSGGTVALSWEKDAAGKSLIVRWVEKRWAASHRAWSQKLWNAPD
jgi:two-component sensor histidine kinase